LQRFVRPPEVAQLLTRWQTDRERTALLARLTAAEGQAAMLALYQDEVAKLTQERDRIAANLEERAEDLRVATEEGRSQADELRQLRYQLRAARAPTHPDETDERPEWPEPTTLMDALIQAKDAFPETLVFTRAAEDSVLAMNPAGNPPARLWRIFCEMDEVCRRWRTNELSQSIHATFQERGLVVKYVSEVTKGRHPHKYFFTYKGERVSVGPHLETSRGERVYWYEDEDDRQFVVNHVGVHLPDTST
jgi:hypothetical protein